MYMVHLQLLAQICSFSCCDLMDACEILKMEGYVSALDDEPDADEFPSSAETLEMAPDGPTYQNPFGETEDEAQAHSPKPEIVNHVALPAHATQNVFFLPCQPMQLKMTS